jgi:hypothetical protein
MKSQENSWGIKMDLGGAADTFGNWTDINLNKTKEFKGASLQFGRSCASKENQDYTSRGMSKHFNVRVRGNRLRIRRNPHKPVVFDPVFYDMLTALSDQSTQSEIFRFIQQFGLGVLSDVHMGATFSNTAYFYDNASTAAISNYTKQVKTGGITLPFLDVNSIKTSQTLNIVDTSLGLSGQWSTSNSLGSLSIGSGACKGLATSSAEILVPIKFDITPLFMLPCVQSHAAARQLAAFMASVKAEAVRCGTVACSSNGECLPSSGAWSGGRRGRVWRRWSTQPHAAVSRAITALNVMMGLFVVVRRTRQGLSSAQRSRRPHRATAPGCVSVLPDAKGGRSARAHSQARTPTVRH